MRIDQVPIDVNLCLIALAAGVLLVYWELARPGMIVPGAVGAVMVVLAAVKLAGSPWRDLRWWVVAPVGLLLVAVTWVLGSAAVRGFIAKRR